MPDAVGEVFRALDGQIKAAFAAFGVEEIEIMLGVDGVKTNALFVAFDKSWFMVLVLDCLGVAIGGGFVFGKTKSFKEKII